MIARDLPIHLIPDWIWISTISLSGVGLVGSSISSLEIKALKSLVSSLAF